MFAGGASAQVRYFGKELGPLAQLQHGVRGRVFAVDSRTLYLQDFHYDGQGPGQYLRHTFSCTHEMMTPVTIVVASVPSNGYFHKNFIFQLQATSRTRRF